VTFIRKRVGRGQAGIADGRDDTAGRETAEAEGGEGEYDPEEEQGDGELFGF
jgi:hypothetical protein